MNETQPQSPSSETPRDERVIRVALEAAARACEQTCGRWQVKRRLDGERELFCPCAESVRSLDPTIIRHDAARRLLENDK